MNTDPRAVALVRFEMPKRECCTTTLQPDPHGQWVLYAEVESALADLAAREAEIDRLKLSQQQSIQDECEAEQRLIDAGISDYEDGEHGEYRGLLTQIDLCIKQRDAAVQEAERLLERVKELEGEA